MKKWLTLDETTKYLVLSASTLYMLAQQGRIPGNKIGKSWRFNKDDLDTWIKANKPIEEFFRSVEAAIEDNPYLRDPQREAYTAASDFFERGGKKAIIQLPVGCGKSGLISILPFGIAKGRVLVIAPNLTIRRELRNALDITNKRTCFWNKCSVLSQETMTAGPYITILEGENANIHDCDQSHIVITNIQQLASSADKWLPQFGKNYFDMILVDEGHHSAAKSWMKAFDTFPDAKVVNLTATPFRSDNKDIEGELIYRYSFKRAMLKGYIKKLQSVYIAPSEIYFTYEGEDYHHTLEEVLQLKEEEWFSRGVALAPECNKHIVDTSLDRLEKLRQTGTNHQLIAVAMSVNHAHQIRSLYSERGYSAEEIHSKMDKKSREEVVDKLKRGMLDCIIQVLMLGEGFDHPKLGVAAIFRPYRTLSPYIQFVGRIMRVVVQNDSRHPDNYGFIVSHVGMNLDNQMAEFKNMDREDQNFFRELMSEGEIEELPAEVLEGRARQKLRPDMIVHNEIVESLFEETFIDEDDELVLEEIKAHAEELGLDGEVVLRAIKDNKIVKSQATSASAPFPVHPQRQRQEARKRLNEEVKRAASLLLNRTDLSRTGWDIAKIFPNIRGVNYVAALQMINHEVTKVLGVNPGDRKKLKTDDYVKAAAALEEILNKMTRRIKATEE